MSSDSKWMNLPLSVKIKTSTDIGDLETQMETRTCKCDCKRQFKVLKSSQQVFASVLCRWALREFRQDRTHAWKTQTTAHFAELNYNKKRGRPKGS